METTPVLPPPQCSKRPQQSRSITVEVDTKLTQLATTVEGVGPVDCISPGSSSGTGDLSIASATSSSQASTIQTVAWSEDNFHERGVALEEWHATSADMKRKSPRTRVTSEVHGPSEMGRPGGRRRRSIEACGVEHAIIEEGNVDVDHLADAECSKFVRRAVFNRCQRCVEVATVCSDCVIRSWAALALPSWLILSTFVRCLLFLVGGLWLDGLHITIISCKNGCACLCQRSRVEE
jgi:hypothetical protein